MIRSTYTVHLGDQAMMEKPSKDPEDWLWKHWSEESIRFYNTRILFVLNIFYLSCIYRGEMEKERYLYGLMVTVVADTTIATVTGILIFVRSNLLPVLIEY